MYIQIKSTGATGEGKVYRISSELNQDGVQRAIDDLYANVLRICGMPSQSGASASTSDTGAATIYRNGWYAAESRASDTEKLFNRAERQFLKVFLAICGSAGGLDLRLGDIKIEHTRNNLSNMQSRMQILCEGLNSDKIHPKIPWLLSGVPNAEEYYQEPRRKAGKPPQQCVREELNYHCRFACRWCEALIFRGRHWDKRLQ